MGGVYEMPKIRGIDLEGISFLLPQLVCKVCGNIWFARKNGEILNCPSCRSTDWNNGKKVTVEIPVLTCPKCKYKWSPRDINLKECPSCKKKLFNF